MNVTRLEGRDQACDEFVLGHPDAKLCHLPVYSEMVRRAGGYDTIYLVAREGAVRGVLPLAHVKSRLFGNRMISHAWCNYGGPLAANPLAAEKLFERVVEIATERGCESIELRNRVPLPFGLESRTGKVCMVLPLVADPEAMWKGLDFKMRNHVRKAQKSGLTTLHGGLELLDDFYELYAIRMRELGTPAYGRRVFQAMLEVLPEHAKLFQVRLESRTVAAGITTTFNGTIEILYGASLLAYHKLAPNNLMYWTIIQHACEAGLRAFDFGRCAVDSGTYQFKKQWGAAPVPLHYQHWVRPGKTLSVASTDNPRYQKRIEMWRKLPLWLTRVLGPRISRGVP